MGGGNQKDEGEPLIVVDTSVTAKYFFDEEGSKIVKELFRVETLAAPDLMLYEFASVLLKQRELSEEELNRFLDLFYQLSVELFVLPQKGFRRALAMARRFGLSAYDASFIALAESLGGDFVTADKKLASKAKALPFVRLL